MGGKDNKNNPLFKAVDAFFHTPGGATITAPHVRDAINIKRIMIIVLFALTPAVFMALYNTGLQANLTLAKIGETAAHGWRGSVLASLGIGINHESIFANMVHGALHFFPIYMISLTVGLFWEAVFAVVRKREMNEMVLVTTLIFPLILPPTIPLWQVALGISFGVVIGKQIYGGFGRNVLNPALVGYGFLFFAYPAQITGDTVWVAVDGVTKATPLAELKLSASSISATWTDAFIGYIPGTMGETSTLACLMGAAILIVTGVGSWRIMLSILAGMVGLSLLFNSIGSDTNPMFQVTPLWHFVVGGFAFGSVFMATDPVTSAMTQRGQYYYGFLIGALVVLIRVVNPSFADGVMLAILFGNVFAPAIDKIVINRNVKRRHARYAG